MDKKIFDILGKFETIENKLYFKLEKELGMEKAEELVDELTDLREKILKIGKHLDNELYIGKDMVLNKRFEDLESYLKIHVIYEYENGWCLGSTTSGLICLVPKNYLVEYE